MVFLKRDKNLFLNGVKKKGINRFFRYDPYQSCLRNGIRVFRVEIVLSKMFHRTLNSSIHTPNNGKKCFPNSRHNPYHILKYSCLQQKIDIYPLTKAL